MTKQYAKGRHAIAECQRSGQKMRYRDLVEDGHIEGLLVHPDWWEPKHPQEIPVTVTDPVALYRPAPEISIPAGYGDPENLDGGTAPTTPNGSDPGIEGITSAAMTVGDLHMAVDVALTYQIGWHLFIESDDPGNTYFVSRITMTANSPTFTVPFTSPFVEVSGYGTAAGNNFYIEAH